MVSVFSPSVIVKVDSMTTSSLSAILVLIRVAVCGPVRYSYTILVFSSSYCSFSPSTSLINSFQPSVSLYLAIVLLRCSSFGTFIDSPSPSSPPSFSPSFSVTSSMGTNKVAELRTPSGNTSLSISNISLSLILLVIMAIFVQPVNA